MTMMSFVNKYGVHTSAAYGAASQLWTYIQMPAETIHRELPVLVVKGPNGSEMVNYRVKENMYIVDRLFDRAALLLGSGKHQVKVELTRHVEISAKAPVQIPQAQPESGAAEGGAQP